MIAMVLLVQNSGIIGWTLEALLDTRIITPWYYVGGDYTAVIPLNLFVM
jgi:hypothetical protein